MAGERNFTRIPPDSTGKRVRLKHTAQIFYSAKTPTSYTWKIGEFYTLGDGLVVHVHGVYEITNSTGILEVHYSKAGTYENSDPTVGTTILDPDTSSTVATVDSSRDVWINTQNIIGYDNPEHGLDIDNTGSANIRFSEGKPQLDAFGKLRVSGATPLGDYIFANDYLPLAFSTLLEGGATVGWDANRRALLLTNTTASGDKVAHTTNTYHHYTPGSSHLWIATVVLGDTGKANLVRNWGLFDSNNGFMFRLSGTALQVVIRSDVQGSVNEIVIDQSDWNVDAADGTLSASNPSGMDIDVTYDNIYWIDVQWLGAGRVRFGTYYNGERVVLHEYYHENRYPYPNAATASLPVCFVQYNSGLTASTSEMRAFCAGVWTETSIDIPSLGRNALETFSKTLDPWDGVSTPEYQYVGTLSPVPTLASGNINRSLYWPTELEVLAWDAVTNAEAIVEVEVYIEPVLSNLSFTAVEVLNPSNSVEKDTNANYYGGGIHAAASFVRGDRRMDLTSAYKSMTYGAFKNYSEDGGTRTQNVVSITQASPAIITMEDPYWKHREAHPGASNPKTISGVSGMTEINGQNVHLKILSANTGALYTDSSLSSPLDTTGYSAYTSGGTMTGLFGKHLHFTILAKNLASNNAVNLRTNLSWKEVNQ